MFKIRKINKNIKAINATMKGLMLVALEILYTNKVQIKIGTAEL